MEQGIIIGCDKAQEWLLPWWWQHYSKHNTHPVAFVDFGMSETAKKWSQKNGIYLFLPQLPEKQSIEIPEHVKIEWEARYGELWPFRSAWFKKPQACLHSPFTKSFWIDLDCQVKADLSPLFHLLSFGIEITLAKDLLPTHKESYFNSGIVGFTQNAPVLHRWAKLSLEHPDLFPGDQEALSKAIYLEPTAYLELPSIYNWSWSLPNNPEAKIIHFHGGQGKLHLIETVKNSKQVESFFQLFDSS